MTGRKFKRGDRILEGVKRVTETLINRAIDLLASVSDDIVVAIVVVSSTQHAFHWQPD